MPGFNRTGPMGAGPMTGGGRGYCHPARVGLLAVYGGYGYGRGLGLKRGFRGGYDYGMGRGYCGRPQEWYPPAAGPAYSQAYQMGDTSEIEILKEQVDHMKNTLDGINRRIDLLQKQSTETS